LSHHFLGSGFVSLLHATGVGHRRRWDRRTRTALRNIRRATT
jgi:hypothetical protein